jgi:hypothetical protein
VDSNGSRYGSVVGRCECGDEPSGSGATELFDLVSKNVSFTKYPKKLNKNYKFVRCQMHVAQGAQKHH